MPNHCRLPSSTLPCGIHSETIHTNRATCSTMPTRVLLASGGFSPCVASCNFGIQIGQRFWVCHDSGVTEQFRHSPLSSAQWGGHFAARLLHEAEHTCTTKNRWTICFPLSWLRRTFSAAEGEPLHDKPTLPQTSRITIASTNYRKVVKP